MATKHRVTTTRNTRNIQHESSNGKVGYGNHSGNREKPFNHPHFGTTVDNVKQNTPAKIDRSLMGKTITFDQTADEDVTELVVRQIQLAYIGHCCVFEKNMRTYNAQRHTHTRTDTQTHSPRNKRTSTASVPSLNSACRSFNSCKTPNSKRKHQSIPGTLGEGRRKREEKRVSEHKEIVVFCCVRTKRTLGLCHARNEMYRAKQRSVCEPKGTWSKVSSGDTAPMAKRDSDSSCLPSNAILCCVPVSCRQHTAVREL